MELSFLTPLAALVALAVLLPVAVFAGRERRGSEIRRLLGLAQPDRRARAALAAALVLLPALLGLAAAQPVLELTSTRTERADAEVFVVLDASRSMLAAAAPGAPTRFERARELAAALQDGVPEVPVGLASMTDRVLPHLFPTTDRDVFLATLERALGVERPPPVEFYAVRATHLGALRTVVGEGFFSPSATKRVLVVATDGEAREWPRGLAEAFARPPGVEAVFVTVWGEEERIYTGAAPDPAYRPDPAGPRTLARLANETGGRAVTGEDAEELVVTARELVGAGPTRAEQRTRKKVALMPYVTALALVPLAFLLARRNL